MLEVIKHTPDITTFAANVVVFLAAIAAAVVGAMSAVKKIKEAWVDTSKNPLPVQTQVIGGLLQDMYGSAMFAEQLRNNTRAQEETCNELREVRHLLDKLVDRMDRHDR